MLAERPLPSDIDPRIRALATAWAEDPEVAAIYLFGSRAGAHPGPRADVLGHRVLVQVLVVLQSKNFANLPHR